MTVLTIASSFRSSIHSVTSIPVPDPPRADRAVSMSDIKLLSSAPFFFLSLLALRGSSALSSKSSLSDSSSSSIASGAISSFFSSSGCFSLGSFCSFFFSSFLLGSSATSSSSLSSAGAVFSSTGSGSTLMCGEVLFLFLWFGGGLVSVGEFSTGDNGSGGDKFSEGSLSLQTYLFACSFTGSLANSFLLFADKHPITEFFHVFVLFDSTS
mmetsp:Transcript_12638/g.17480  ORF Transcript_12638/g.17480 Transcript_12638/m.17480 type:complete len:211 (-) Transcript_12638:221-853(-)